MKELSEARSFEESPGLSRARGPTDAPGSVPFAAFMSYSHTDARVAVALQRGLHRFARHWYQKRALRVFRDDAVLAANGALWPSIREALDRSAFLILLASPAAARSEWVDRENRAWLEHHHPDSVLIVLTGGHLLWDDATDAIDTTATTALPPALHGAFAHEPRYIDLRWASTEDDLSLRNPRFRESVADLAAPLHGQPKDELIGEDVRHHRRARRLARSAVAALVTLALLATSFAFMAKEQRDTARRQRDTATSRQLAAQAQQEVDAQLPRAALLSLEALRLSPTSEARAALLTAVWKTDNLLSVIETHPNPLVPSVAWDPTGRLLAYGERDGAVVVWDIRARRRLGDRLQGHTKYVDGLAFSPDGTRLASTGADGSVRIWDLLPSPPTSTLFPTPDGDSKSSVAFSADGERLAVGGSGKVTIFSTEDKRAVTPALDANTFAVHKDGRTLALAANHQVVLWDLNHGRIVATHPSPHSKPVYQLAFDAAGEILVSSSMDKQVVLWDLKPLQPRGEPLHGYQELRRDGGDSPSASARRKLQEGDRDAHALAVSHDGILLSGGIDDSVVVWSLANKEMLTFLPLNGEERAYAMAFSPDGEQAAVATSQGRVLIWDLYRTHALKSRFRGHTNWVNATAFSPDSRRLASGDRDGMILIWDAPRGEGQPTRLSHGASVSSLAFAPDGDTLASSGGNSVIVWDTRTGTPAGTRTFAENIRRIAFSPDGQTLALASDKHVWLSSVSVSRPDRTLDGKHPALNAVAFAPDGRTLATGSSEGAIVLWDVRTGRPRGKPLKGHTLLYSLAFSEDGHTLASGGGVADGNVILWDVRNGRRLGELTGHTDAVTGVGFSRDGRTLVSSNADSSLLLWDVETRQQIGPPLLGHGAVVEGMAYSPDGTMVASAGWDGSVVVWDLRPDAWKERACLLASRNLTRDEWDRFLPDRDYHQTCENLPVGRGVAPRARSRRRAAG